MIFIENYDGRNCTAQFVCLNESNFYIYEWTIKMEEPYEDIIDHFSLSLSKKYDTNEASFRSEHIPSRLCLFKVNCDCCRELKDWFCKVL